MRRFGVLLMSMLVALGVSTLPTVPAGAAPTKFEKPPLPGPSETPPIPAQSEQSFAVGGGDCASLPGKLAQLSKSGKRFAACVENVAPQAESAGDVTTNAIQPAPAFCRTDGQWWFIRTGACLVSSGRVSVIRVDNGELVGELFFNFVAYSYTSASISTWAHQLQFQATSAWGFGVGSSVEGFATCAGQCTLASSSFPRQPMLVGQFANGESFHNTTATGPGAVGFATTPFNYFFTNPAWTGPTNTASVTPPRVRCDNALPGVTSVGCVFPDYVPAIVYALSGPYPELASHISRAHASGLPGAYPIGSPLTRLVDPTLQNQNRDVACLPTYPRPPGKSCDEYPFASSNQGAFTGGGQPRTFDGCAITLLLPGSTGPSGFSVCMIDATQNSTGGSVLGLFYKDNRVISSDAFRVWTP